MMKNKCKKRIAAIVMCACLLMGLMPTKVYAAENPVSLYVYSIETQEEADAGPYVYRNGVTVTFTPDTQITPGTFQTEYQHGMTIDYYWPMQDPEGMLEDGYDKVAEFGILFPLTDYVGTELTGSITIPLPSGYDGATAKIKGGATATSYTDTTVTFPVTLKVASNDDPETPPTEYLASTESLFYVEYKQKQQQQQQPPQEQHSDDDDDDDDNEAESGPDEALATATQQFAASTMEEFAKTTTVSSTVDATITIVSTDTAKAAIAQAKTVVGENAFVASIVELNVPAGTGEATFTLGCPNVWAGQNVTILHQKADGSWESIKPTKVADNSVTFTLTSYSPIAVVINTTAPKTGDMVMVVAGLAVICLAGIAVFGRKAKLN